VRVTENRQTLSAITVAAGVGTFGCDCHGLVANDKVVFTGTYTELPCGLELNTIYYVIASGLTTDAFKVSATLGGSELALSGTATGTFYVAQPMDLTGYTVDADIYGLLTDVQEATMTCTLSDATNGVVSLAVPPATSAAMNPGRYGYDVSFTSSGGSRYYFLKGIATVERTYSRN
jgi:hypothetical protein